MAAALAAFGQLDDRFADQFGQDLGGMRHAGDGFGEAALGGDRRRGDARVERAGRIAEQAAQRGRGAGAETRGNVRHRPRRQIADRLEPGADERGRRLGVELKRGDGQAADRGRLVGGGARLVARERARGVGGGAKRMAQGHPEPGQPPVDVVDQPRLTLEQVGAAVMSSISPSGASSATSGV